VPTTANLSELLVRIGTLLGVPFSLRSTNVLLHERTAYIFFLTLHVRCADIILGGRCCATAENAEHHQEVRRGSAHGRIKSQD
jgi:hypothetical protein